MPLLELLLFLLGAGVFAVVLVPLMLTFTAVLVSLLVLLAAGIMLFLFSPLLLVGAFSAALLGSKLVLLAVLVGAVVILTRPSPTGGRMKALLRGQKSGFMPPEA